MQQPAFSKCRSRSPAPVSAHVRQSSDCASALTLLSADSYQPALSVQPREISWLSSENNSAKAQIVLSRLKRYSSPRRVLTVTIRSSFVFSARSEERREGNECVSTFRS